MPGFKQIVGHEETIRHLQTAILQEKVSHAYIFQGVPGTGKRTLADAFAAALQCDTLAEKDRAALLPEEVGAVNWMYVMPSTSRSG